MRESTCYKRITYEFKETLDEYRLLRKVDKFYFSIGRVWECIRQRHFARVCLVDPARNESLTRWEKWTVTGGFVGRIEDADGKDVSGNVRVAHFGNGKGGCKRFRWIGERE